MIPIVVLVVIWIIFSAQEKQKKQIGQKPKKQQLNSTRVQKKQRSTTHRRTRVKQQVYANLDTYEADKYEDEESYDTELHTPMSPEADDGEVYTNEEWESLTQQFAQPARLGKQHRQRKRFLKQAVLYSEVLNKPKGLLDD